MSLVNPSQSNPGDTIEAADINTPINQLAAVINGNIDGANIVSSPALTTPSISGSINDANGNEVIKTPATSSAVNEITVTNAATGNAPSIAATGGDADISLRLRAKGSGTQQHGRPVAFYGTTTQSYTNGSAADVTSYTEVFDYGSNFGSGVFTAPYDGIYHFDVVMGITDAGSSSGRLDVALQKNGGTVARGHGPANATNADPTGNIAMTLNLTAGDAVKVNITNNTGATESLSESSFSGFLVGRTD